jgi:hypothetical protein
MGHPVTAKGSWPGCRTRRRPRRVGVAARDRPPSSAHQRGRWGLCRAGWEHPMTAMSKGRIRRHRDDCRGLLTASRRHQPSRHPSQHLDDHLCPRLDGDRAAAALVHHRTQAADAPRPAPSRRARRLRTRPLRSAGNRRPPDGSAQPLAPAMARGQAEGQTRERAQPRRVRQPDDAVRRPALPARQLWEGCTRRMGTSVPSRRP